VPWYCFTTDDGETLERECPMRRIPRKITLDDGRVAVRDRRAELCDFKNTPGNWPMKSLALGCHPRQREEYYEFTKKHGVPTHIDERGDAIIPDRTHRKKLAQLFKCVDYDGGYGDPT